MAQRCGAVKSTIKRTMQKNKNSENKNNKINKINNIRRDAAASIGSPKKPEDIVVLAIESSCDETAAAIVRGGRYVLSDVISSQIEIHKQFGGVVPEVASRRHLENINGVAERAVSDAGLKPEEIDAVAVTACPGLVGALLIGVATAKALAYAWKKPLIAVHHIHGHVCANYIEHEELKPPFISMVVSGGHTSIVDVRDYNDLETLGSTRDDAVGEAYDKVARVLGLGYPGGPLIDELAKSGDEYAVDFKRVYLEKDSLDFSFSGTKTGVLNYVNSKHQARESYNKADLAASFQRAVLDVIVKKAVKAVKEKDYRRLALAGGVSANSRLRELMQTACDKENIELYFPSLRMCTDNAVMIAVAAYHLFMEGQAADLWLDARANADFDVI